MTGRRHNFEPSKPVHQKPDGEKLILRYLKASKSPNSRPGDWLIPDHLPGGKLLK